jgi:hypothetical protein
MIRRITVIIAAKSINRFGFDMEAQHFFGKVETVALYAYMQPSQVNKISQ